MNQSGNTNSEINQQGETIVVLGTGGTIAGVSADGDDRHYRAAQLSVADLVAAVPELAQVPMRARQVAQIDSKDMGWSVWRELLAIVQIELSDPHVAGVVITHGTDTLEETALLMHLLLAVDKPVVLTAAMRPATSKEADGPGNLRDAVQVARWAAQHQHAGVVAVLHGRIWAGKDVRKAHSWHIDAFDGGDQAPLGWVEEGTVRETASAWPAAHGWACHVTSSSSWPEHLPPVAIVLSHADADADVALVDAWSSAQGASPGPRGLVVAGTGHGSLHEALEAAMARAQQAGLTVWRSTRVARGGILPADDERWSSTGTLTPVQARLALSLALRWRPEQCASWAQAISD